MFYLLYQITNKLDGKIYVGVHKTTNMNDGYMGSGNRIQNALKKYGKDCFKKTILEYHTNYDDLLKAEANIVTEEFINSDHTYNLKTGGHDGRPSLETRKKLSISQSNYEASMTIEQQKKRRLARQRAMKKAKDNGYDPGLAMRGKKHSLTSKEKMTKSHQKHKHQQGEKNSQYGTYWIYNLDLEQCRRLNNDDTPPIGWIRGRKTNFIIHKNKLHKKENRKKKIVTEDLEKIKKYTAWYTIYQQYRFKKFCQLTGYNKSQPNLVRRFQKFVKTFKARQGNYNNKNAMERI